MTDTNTAKKFVLDEIINRGKLGDKKFHSETSLQQFGEEQSPDIIETPTDDDPGVHNESVGNGSSSEDQLGRRRTMSQPGPMSGNLLTATAARAARRRPQRNVMYHPDIERSDSASERQSPRILMAGREETGSLTPIGDRASPLSYNGNLRNGDAKSLNSYRLYMPQNETRGSATPRKRSVATMDAQSIRSVETHAPPPTDPEENKKQTKRYVTLVMSCMYAILIITLGLIIYLGDSFVDLQISEVYSIVLCGIGMIYVLFLIIDINRYKSIAVKNHKIKAQHEEKVLDYFRKQEEQLGSVTPGDRTPDSYRPPGMPPPVLIPNKHEYCFSQGRHSGSFYLKMGAAGFALGHLVHSLLLLAVQVGQLMDNNIDNDECVKILQVVLDVMLPAYCFLQLYFIFKYSNVIILKAQSLAHFAFMHLIGSSLCFWISAIVRETLLSLTLYASSRDSSAGYSDFSDNHSINEHALSIDERFINVSNLYNPNCNSTAAISSIYENFSPYLYPFNVEFNILIVAIYYIIWSNIGNCDNEDNGSDINSTSDDNYHLCKIPTANEDNDFTSNIVIYADCHASNRGLFLGLIVMVIITGMLIIGFVFSSVGDDFVEVGYLLNSVTRLGLHTLLLLAALIAWNQMRQLDINEHPISLLDDVLLFICLPAFFMETAFSLVATITFENIVKSIDFVVMVIQVLIQTPLIMDGLRRCSNSKKLRRKKPGREVLMFLLTANVAMWIFNTFSYKSPDSLDERYEYYGKVIWSILGHISLPLIMFYRFHSSVCFADIWDSAYKPGSEH
ncbi:proton channel OtopLc-like [Trichoplusia ni]|uniref:Proton channel OtopLc-like n=1 Tax=Trichoplusia ni TaxID=7111 RepID=A0A7E5X1K7_TRINI|nr:proton channel OtopLc-like [Trichoplusia ni]